MRSPTSILHDLEESVTAIRRYAGRNHGVEKIVAYHLNHYDGLLAELRAQDAHELARSYERRRDTLYLMFPALDTRTQH